MNRTKRAYWFLGAALLALLAVCVYVFVLSNGKDADKTRTTALLDETDQNPRVQPLSKQTENGKAEASGAPESASQSGGAAEAEGAQASDAETGMGDLGEKAREYDRYGQIGEPPEGWREDYSHWDLRKNPKDLEEIGLVDKEAGGSSYIFQPTEEARQRMGEIQREIAQAEEEGLLTQETKSGYVRRVHYGEMAVYAAPDFIEHYDALLNEFKQINEQNMQETSGGEGFFIFPEKFTSAEYSKVKIRYYRREDGSLMREATLPSGEMKTFVAGPPPDLSGYSERAIEFMRANWGGTKKRRAFDDRHTFSTIITPVPNP